jgi:hypothetical protein
LPEETLSDLYEAKKSAGRDGKHKCLLHCYEAARTQEVRAQWQVAPVEIEIVFKAASE